MPSTAARTAPVLRLRSVRAIRFTRENVARMVEIGILPEKYELLDGEIIDKMGQGIPHRRGVSLLFAWLIRAWDAMSVQTQAGIDVSPEDNPTNAPEPDLCVLNQPLASFVSNPPASAVDLVIEIGDSTLDTDLSKKAALYARAGIPEYWVYDPQNQVVHVHRTPVDGSYSGLTTVQRGSEIAPLARPDHPFRLD